MTVKLRKNGTTVATETFYKHLEKRHNNKLKHKSTNKLAVNQPRKTKFC